MNLQKILTIVFSVCAFIVSIVMLVYLWITPCPIVGRILGTAILAALMVFSGRSLWLNILKPFLYRLTHHEKLF